MKLNVIEVLTNGIKIGVANVVTLLLTSLLWMVSLLIPYINVGTTIALMSLPVGMSKGTFMAPTEIFSAKYRRHMGEFFLLSGLLFAGIVTGMFFLIIPGIVIAIAWSQAAFLLFDRGMNPVECLRASNAITYGEKWKLCFIWASLAVVFVIFGSVFGFVVEMILGETLRALFFLALSVVYIAASLGVAATIYRILASKLDDPDFAATLK